MCPFPCSQSYMNVGFNIGTPFILNIDKIYAVNLERYNFLQFVKNYQLTFFQFYFSFLNVMAVLRSSRRLHCRTLCFNPIYGRGHGSPPSLNTCCRNWFLFQKYESSSKFELETSDSKVGHSNNNTTGLKAFLHT